MRNEWENVVPAKAGIQIKTTKEKRITGEAHTQRVTPYLTSYLFRLTSPCNHAVAGELTDA